MNATQQQAITVTSAINSLKDLHKKVVASLEATVNATSPVGTLTVSSDAISCLCLDHNVTATFRPIVIDGKISALEYDFVTPWKKEEISILRLYLQPGGIITRDARGTEKLCDFNNTYIKNFVLGAVFESLLKSYVYAPVEG